MVIGYGNASVSAPSERAIRWDDDGRALDLGSFGGRGWSEARDINDAGLIVGNSSTDDDSHSRAFVFDPAVGHIAELASLPGGGASYVFGLNDDGLAVGYQSGSGGPARPVLWDVPAGTATDLTPRTGPAFPTAINDEGTILVRVPNGPNGLLPHEIALLEPGASLERVGPTSAGCLPIDINDQDVVVGFCYTGGPRAFRWDRASGMVDLAPGHPSFAWGINNAGTIVGSSDYRAVVFVVLPDDENPGGSAVAAAGEGRDAYDSPFDPPEPVPPVGGLGTADSTAAFLFAPPVP